MKSSIQSAKVWFPDRPFCLDTIEPVPVHPDVDLEDDYNYSGETADGTTYIWFWNVDSSPNRRTVRRRTPDGTITTWTIPISLSACIIYWPMLGACYRLYPDGSLDIEYDNEFIYVKPNVEVEPVDIKVSRFRMYYEIYDDILKEPSHEFWSK